MILQYDDFRGGYWTGGGSTKLAAPETGLLQAENCEYFLGPNGKVWIRGRRGKNRLNTGLQLPGRIASIWRLYRRADGPFTLVGYADGTDGNRVKFEHDTDDNGLLEALSGSPPILAAGLIPQWVTVAEREACYGVTGGSGLLKYDGSELAELPLRGGAFAATGSMIGPYIALHQQRLWVTDNEYPTSRIWAFGLNEEDLVPATNDFLIEDPQGSKIVGLASWNEYLLIFKETAVFRLSGSPESADSASLVRVSPIGCVAPYSIQVTPDGVMYLSRDGLRITDGQHTRGLDVAVAIRNLFVSPGEQHLYRNAVSSYSLRKNQYRINLDGGDVTHILQRLETLEGPVWLWSTAANQEAVVFADGEGAQDNGRVFAGDTTGKVWEFDVGKTDREGSRDTPWNMTIQIPFSRVSDPAQLGWGQITRLGLEWVSQLRPEVQCFYDNRDAIAHQAVVGVDLAYTGVQIEEVGLDDQKGLGHWVSVKMIIEDASFENEVHQIHTHVTPRGHRTRRRMRLAEY